MTERDKEILRRMCNAAVEWESSYIDSVRSAMPEEAQKRTRLIRDYQSLTDRLIKEK